MTECDACGRRGQELQVFDCYNPADQESCEKYVCHGCVHKRVEDYFDPTKAGSW